MHAMPEGLNGIKLDLNEFDMNDWFLIPFMDLCDPDILDAVYEHLNFVYESPEMRSKTDGFRSFVRYLLNNYLLQDSKFPFHQCYYHDSIQNGDMGITTNPLENINFLTGHIFISNTQYDPENCFVTGKKLFLHQDASTKTSYVLFQDSYQLTSKEEFNKKRSFA